ncbi:MAG: hypothetical protein QOG65_3059, partial [Actinomycetota bacterium]|nr:hypothetical protein [Actinomycetota bacterium]
MLQTYLRAGVATALLIVAVAVPTSAASGATTATITVSGGVLAISAPTTAGNLGSRANSVDGGTISGPL